LGAARVYSRKRTNEKNAAPTGAGGRWIRLSQG